MTPDAETSRRSVARWLLACCALVFAMVVVGGITRLTHSGLSIVEWQPLVGAVPPLGDHAWEETFAKYRESPEFRLRNHDMTLAGFKEIFWWEYFHRLLGRLIGLVFIVPFAWFLARRAISGALAWKLAAVFALGGLQGAIGWYMVQSGLVDDPHVSPVRLAMHLGMALAIYAAMLWIALGLLARESQPPSRIGAGAIGFAALVFAMALTGALVAGIHAGYAYNTFPTMNGRWIPDEILAIDPWWKNFVWNMATVQFDHRVLALAVAACAALLCGSVLSSRDSRAPARRWAWALAAAVAVQVSLGIATLLERVPIPLAALHQAGAVIVFSCAVGLAHSLAARRLQA